MGSLGVTEKAGRVRVVPTTHGSSSSSSSSYPARAAGQGFILQRVVTLPAAPQGLVLHQFFLSLLVHQQAFVSYVFLFSFFFLFSLLVHQQAFVSYVFLSLPCPHSGAGSYIASVSSASSFCQHVNISYMLHSILTKLGQNDQYLDCYSHTNNSGVKGHDGVTRVKKVIFTKIAIFRTDYMIWSCDSYIFIS